ncbi:hypothetical protein ANCCEY_08546 [Ancylostoma ceylanicum]|uniref:Uncharacterized protein n=1 Tax=Ancylostoma ceylanicum TaxID=53326 RepID=A0A0D6LMH3_9BILA|nr:hypothetical protein ANCCEY_08546 [Ancylostoma ceylanicum]
MFLDPDFEAKTMKIASVSGFLVLILTDYHLKIYVKVLSLVSLGSARGWGRGMGGNWKITRMPVRESHPFRRFGK